MQSRVLTPTDTGTRLSFNTAEPLAGITEENREILRAGIEDFVKGFKNLLESDVASGKITLAR